MSQTYHVEWSIEIDAETPEEAARKALEIQRDSASCATVFDVYEMDGDGEATRIDLDDLDVEPGTALTEGDDE